MDATTYETVHEVDDPAKLRKLVASMRKRGWIGAPLVLWDDILLTGTHRYAAARRVGIEVPTIDVTEVFAEAGLDFEAIHADYDSPTIDEWFYVVAILDQLPWDIRDKYGIDAH